MSRPKVARRRQKLLNDTKIEPKDELAIDEAEYMLRQLALAGKLKEHSGTLRQRYAMWLSCFDVVMVPRTEGHPKDHFLLAFDCAGIEEPSRDPFRPGDVDAAIRFTLFTLLKLNCLILLPAGEADRMRKNDLISFYRLSEEKAGKVLKKARDGDPVAYELLRDMLRQYQDCGDSSVSMPTVIRNFRDLVLDNKIEYRPPVGMTKSQTQRDAELIKLAYHFTEKGYSPTRSKDSPTKEPGALFIVEQAAARLGITITEKQLERRWSTALSSGDIRKQGRFGYHMPNPLDELIPMLEGMEVVTAVGNTIFPSVTADIDHLSRLLDWSESKVPNDEHISTGVTDIESELARVLRSAMSAVGRMEGYAAQSEVIKSMMAAAQGRGQAAEPEIAVLADQQDALERALKSELAQLIGEFPLFARMWESTIPDPLKEAGTFGATECVRLLLDATTEVHHESTEGGSH
ncbi:hypothetical protein [Hyphomicrobium sp. CS1BSMeth3]|uniref:hypothetical protein n=1 Tax=Hyphomicrobium sp. CS1BSMeth3 TaxID=1892844 RepID=UPI0009303205|nr:hypothetical protein [Hyphomicrobium sp. CS1BSMeth3]